MPIFWGLPFLPFDLPIVILFMLYQI